MGFLDPGNESEDLEPGKQVNLPLWYIKELKPNNPFFTIEVPDIYKNIHKAVCEAEATQIELGKLHLYFYEYGRCLTPYDRNNVVGRIVFETIRQRIRHLLDLAKNTTSEAQPEHKLETIENSLYQVGVRTNSLFTEWLQFKSLGIGVSELVQEHAKKRKRLAICDDGASTSTNPSKRTTV